jgi:pseudaminic acid cytidylyltransferase
MARLAIIPARGGSKRIKGKNIKPFHGKPIILWSIETALSSGLFEEIMVSTDDKSIAETAIQAGASIPFYRSLQTSGDHATLAEVVGEVLDRYKADGKFFSEICCILPTAPFITPDLLHSTLEMLHHENLDSVFPVVQFSYPILRALEFDEKNKMRMIWPEHLTTRSQDLKPAYHDSGMFYWVRTEAFDSEKRLICLNGSGLIIPETHVQDIDSETDWKLAEMKFRLLHE